MTNTSPLGQNPIMPDPINPNSAPVQNAPVSPTYPVTHEPAAPEVVKPVIESLPTANSNPITSPLNSVTEPIPFDPSKAPTNTFNPQTNIIGSNDGPVKTKGKMNVFAAILIVILIIALLVFGTIFVLNGSMLLNLNPTPTPVITIEPTQVITDNTNTDNTVIKGVLINPMVTEVKTESRLEITSPLAYQVVPKEGTVISIKGHMKGFFEGVMNFRIVDERYYEIASGIIQAQGDNLTGFAPFEKQFTVPNFADNLEVRGMLEFSETSMKDGVNIVVASVPLVFR